MKWYIFCILIGILSYLFINNIDRFSIGGLSERDSCPLKISGCHANEKTYQAICAKKDMIACREHLN